VAGDGSHGILLVTLRNRGTGTAYLGGTSSISSGYALSSGDAALGPLKLYPTDELWAVSTGAAPVLDVMRTAETT
jgi:hypothetical protein